MVSPSSIELHSHGICRGFTDDNHVVSLQDFRPSNAASKEELNHPTSYPHADRVNVSPQLAEQRANLGQNASLGQIQAFDGPAPETINGRLCMLAVPLALWWEATSGLDIARQTGDHPWAVLATFVIISLASYVPLVR